MIHGRPTAFQGERFSNIFVHFAPVEGWDVSTRDVEEAARVGARKKHQEKNRERSEAATA